MQSFVVTVSCMGIIPLRVETAHFTQSCCVPPYIRRKRYCPNFNSRKLGLWKPDASVRVGILALGFHAFMHRRPESLRLRDPCVPRGIHARDDVSESMGSLLCGSTSSKQTFGCPCANSGGNSPLHD